MNNLSSQSIEVLFVGNCDKLCQTAVVFLGIERLPPCHARAFRVRLKFESQHKVMTVEVFDLEELIRNDTREAAFVRVVFAVWPVHR